MNPNIESSKRSDKMRQRRSRAFMMILAFILALSTIFVSGVTEVDASSKSGQYQLMEIGDSMLLVDGKGRKHTITFKGFSDYDQFFGTMHMSHKVNAKSNFEPTIVFEFYQEKNGNLTHLRDGHIDVYGILGGAMNLGINNKADFAHQAYIYLRVGVKQFYYNNEPYSDYILVKVENPYFQYPKAPTVNKIGNKDTVVTGKAAAGTTVYVEKDNVRLGKAKVNGSGNYSVKIKKQKIGTKLKVYVIGNDEKSKSKTVTVEKKNYTPPKTPTVNKVTAKSTAVKGKTDANATVYVKKGKTQLGKAKADKAGNYSVKIKKQKTGTTLTVTAENSDGIVSKAKTIKVSK